MHDHSGSAVLAPPPVRRVRENFLWSSDAVRLAAVCGVFFASGAASLICEVVWFKQLQFVLGSSTFAVSVVVASFFGGLAVGSWQCGKRVDHWSNLLRCYAALELALAVVSAAVTLLLSFWEQWVGWLAPWLGHDSPWSGGLMISICMLILLPPTTLMGATLPVLARYLVRQKRQLAGRVGLLYGLNTLGAATGCFLVGFLLIGLIGVVQSALVGSAIYATIGLAVIAISSRSTSTAGDRDTSETPQTIAEDHQHYALVKGRLLLIIFGLMGFSAIAYEVLWFRILTCFSLHSVYVFSGMLTVYLIGLVLGSLICARYLAPRKERHLLYLARVQLLIASSALISLAILGRSRNIIAVLAEFEKTLGMETFLSGALSGVMSCMLLSLLVLLPPTVLIGIAFPLATELTVQKLSHLGSRLGALYSLNTIGGVLGSLVTAFCLLPMLGSQWSFLSMVALNLVLFALIAVSHTALRKNGELWREGALTACVLCGVSLLMGHDYLKRAQTQFESAEVLAFRESADSTFIVLGYESEITQPYQQLIVNGRSFANNSPPGRRYMSTLAHLPALLHPNPKNSVVIAVGTGTTAGCLTLHPTIEKVWAVDIARDVFDFAPYFVPLNHDFMNSSKVRPVVADGRHFLLTTDERFDVLTFEPPPPSDAGVVNLYSREFYQLARRRLAKNGMVCQWIPLDQPRESLSRMMLRSMMDEFRHVSLWISNRCEGIAVASDQPLAIDYAELNTRMSHPLLQADLQAYGMAEPEQLLATFLAADEDLSEFVGDVPAVTDNRPRLEYFNMYPLRLLRYDEILPYRKPVQKRMTTPPPDPSRMQIALDVITDIWYAHELKFDRKYAAARDRLQHALQLDPANRYLRYLLAEVEQQSSGVVSASP